MIPLLIVVISCCMLLLFLLLGASLVYNIYHYLLKQGRRKEFHMAFFYSLTSIIVAARVIYFSMCLDYSLRDCGLTNRMPI